MANGPLVQKAPTVEVLYSSAFYIKFQERALIPKHVFGTIMETIAGEAEKMFSSIINRFFIAPKFESSLTCLSEIELLRGEKCKNPLYSNGSQMTG